MSSKSEKQHAKNMKSVNAARAAKTRNLDARRYGKDKDPFWVKCGDGCYAMNPIYVNMDGRPPIIPQNIDGDNDQAQTSVVNSKTAKTDKTKTPMKVVDGAEIARKVLNDLKLAEAKKVAA